jgi:hypothetical protein
MKYLENSSSKLRTIFTFEILVLRYSKLYLMFIGFMKLFFVLTELLELYFWFRCTRILMELYFALLSLYLIIKQKRVSVKNLVSPPLFPVLPFH